MLFTFELQLRCTLLKRKLQTYFIQTSRERLRLTLWRERVISKVIALGKGCDMIGKHTPMSFVGWDVSAGIKGWICGDYTDNELGEAVLRQDAGRVTDLVMAYGSPTQKTAFVESLLNSGSCMAFLSALDAQYGGLLMNVFTTMPPPIPPPPPSMPGYFCGLPGVAGPYPQRDKATAAAMIVSMTGVINASVFQGGAISYTDLDNAILSSFGSYTLFRGPLQSESDIIDLLYADNSTRVRTRLCADDNTAVLGVEPLSSLFPDAMTESNSIGDDVITTNTSSYTAQDYVSDMFTYLSRTQYNTVMREVFGMVGQYLDKYVINEQDVYGSSRLGMVAPDSVIYSVDYSGTVCSGTKTALVDNAATLDSSVVSSTEYMRYLGNKRYELSDHLGNVLAVISDKKSGAGVSLSGYASYYKAEVINEQDYYPFGMEMKERGYSLNTGSEYKYGWNGQMHTDEISGAGNHSTAMYWEYDSRTGRRWNPDPKYTASESRYAVNGNSPIIYVDPLGDFKNKFGAWLYKSAHGGTIGKDAVSRQYFVAKKVEYTGEGAGIANQIRFDWNGANKPYTGSGWGHSARSLVANALSVNGTASNLWDMGMNSMLQNSSVQLTGNMLDKVKQDPAVQNLENDLVNRVQSDSRFGKEAFTYSSLKNPVQLGGQRGSLNPLDPSSAATWQVAGNPLTWAVRSVNIEVQVKVSAEGCMNITYSFTDNFDLRPEKGGKVYFGDGNRPWQYNATTSILGLLYHDLFGGNDKMKVNATWQSNR